MLHVHMLVLIWGAILIVLTLLSIGSVCFDIHFGISYALIISAVLSLLTVSTIASHATDIQANYMMSLDSKIEFCEQLLKVHGGEYPKVSLKKEKYEQERNEQKEKMGPSYVQKYDTFMKRNEEHVKDPE